MIYIDDEEKEKLEEKKPEDMSPQEQDRHDEFNELIGLILTMDPARYAQITMDRRTLSKVPFRQRPANCHVRHCPRCRCPARRKSRRGRLRDREADGGRPEEIGAE